MSVPVRSCVGCRGRFAAADLLRVVAIGGVLIPDPRRRMPGRGVYVHPTSACVLAADKRRVWARALRANCLLCSDPVHAAVAQIGRSRNAD